MILFKEEMRSHPLRHVAYTSGFAPKPNPVGLQGAKGRSPLTKNSTLQTRLDLPSGGVHHGARTRFEGDVNPSSRSESRRASSEIAICTERIGS